MREDRQRLPGLGVETHSAVILAYVGGIALHIWTIRSYFYTIPAEIEECAKVDGATQAQAFLYILLPMAVPILMVVFVLAFIGGMIEYPIASILLRLCWFWAPRSRLSARRDRES